MFRHCDPLTGEPVAFGFPWDYAEDAARGPASPLYNYIAELKPYVEEAIAVSVCCGHNTSFDALFTFKGLSHEGDHVPIDADGNIRQEWREAQHRLNRIADAFRYDTWHMAYTRRQERGSLGLEVIAYDFAPKLAGYEEEFTLLIELERDLMHPENGGHYARCPADKWDTHLKPYVLGDVEACYQARESIQAKLDDSIVYRIPIAHPEKRGLFRYFQPQNRAWIYDRIMSPASRTLTKLMGRGMFIDVEALAELEDLMPKAILGSINKLKKVGNGVVIDYIKRMTDTDKEKNNPDLSKRWEFDVEKKDQLREVLFDLLGLKVQRLTKAGRKLYGEDPDKWEEAISAEIRAETPALVDSELATAVRSRLLNYAALDKFTLNKLAVDHEEVRPLQDYRKIHKLYSTYVRPLRNMRFIGIDKKERSRTQHLCPDGCIHAQFMLTGTRGGRLSCRNPNLQQLPKEGVKHESADLQVKKMYVSRFGKDGCLYGADFSQIELRLLAALSGDESMVNAYFEDTDLHTLTASRIFNLPYDTFSKDHRRELEHSGRSKEAKELSLNRDIAKTTNFLTGYGGGALGLQTVLANKQIYRSIEECERTIEIFFESYPAIKDLLRYYKRFIEDHEVAVSVFGRVRVFEEVKGGDPEAKSKALRAGCNHLIQSTASDMMLICLGTIEQMMRDEGLDSMLVSTVHDSLVVDTLRHELARVHEITDLVLNNMPEVFKAVLGEDYDTSWMIVPFAGDSDVGLNYGDMRGVPKGTDIDWDELLAAKK
jgi:DNA polymerase I-like protein with 3'-5' exonuclease and polymerase domains